MVYKVVQQSAVLKPSATLGVITSGPRVSVSRLGTEHFVTTAVGSTFHIYDCDNLQLQYLSRPLLAPIRVLLNIGECTAVACDADIMIFHKMSMLLRLVGHSGPVEQLSSVGDSFLVSSFRSEVCVWKLPSLSKTFHTVLEPMSPFNRLEGFSFEVASMLHVPTYLNKILFGGVNGELELWNVNTGVCVFKFLHSSRPGVAVTSMAASPAVDVVGLGFADGTVLVVDVLSDEQIMSLCQKEHGPVTALSFRCDYADGMLVAGTSGGDLVVWDLLKKRVHSFHQGVHVGGVASLFFLDTLPLVLSSGVADNALCVHIFDKPDGGCRLLKERRGFTSDLKFVFGYSDHDLIVAGGCEVGKLNLIQSQQNKVWPQSSALKCASSSLPWKFRNMHKLPTIVDLAQSGQVRHFDWPCVVSAHVGLPDAYVWSAHQQALVSRMLIVPRKATTGSIPPNVVKVAVSSCGNYSVLGFENGQIHRFNLQSCAYRGEVCTLANLPVCLHFLNSRDLLVADLTEISIWKIVPRPVLLGKLTCVTDIAKVSIHNYLCAVSHVKKVAVSVVDIQADCLCRLIPVGAPVVCMAWSDGGRWLAIATEDSRMIVYEIPTATVVDRIEFSSVCSTILFAAGNTQIVTSHAGQPGAIRVWQNIALMSVIGAAGPDFVCIDDSERLLENANKKCKLAVAITKEVTRTFSRELELSRGSRTLWQQTLKLDEIKERNRPIRGAEKPKSAPFFLPTKYHGVEPVFVAESALGDVTPEVKVQLVEMDSGFANMMKQKNFAIIRAHFLALSPAGVHVCISQLEEEPEHMQTFLDFLTSEAELGNNIDLVATWTALVLKSGNSLPNISKLFNACKNAHKKFEAESNQLQCLLKVAAALQLHR